MSTFSLYNSIDFSDARISFIQSPTQLMKILGSVVDSKRDYVLPVHFNNPSYCCKHPRILPQMNVSGEENSGRIDYAIKKYWDNLLEEIICITKGK